MGEGTTRYVIDYYYDNSKSEEDAVPELGMRASDADIKSIVVDVRPALDSLASVYHRLRRFPERAYQAFQRGMPAEPDMAGPGTGYEKEAAEKQDRISALAAAARPAVASAEAAVSVAAETDPVSPQMTLIRRSCPLRTYLVAPPPACRNWHGCKRMSRTSVGRCLVPSQPARTSKSVRRPQWRYTTVSAQSYARPQRRRSCLR
jgi:hypothetical protein